MPKNGEVIQLHVGQAGIQMANACWELYCLEHGITTKGHPKYPDCAWNTFFGVSSAGKIVPRLVMVDLEPTAIDEIRTGHYRQLFHPSTLITGKEDAASNFARGYYVLGKEIADVTMDTIRKVAETCSNLDGFILYRSIGGGTGGGLGTLMLEHLDADYGKTTKLEFEVFPSPTISPVIVEPYNAILATHSSMNYCDCTFLVDNESLYDICAKRLDVPHPNYTNLNRLVGQILSSITAPLRFESKINVTFNDFKTNLVPYPRIHYPLVTYAPIIPGKKSTFPQITARQLTMECFEPANQMVKCNPRYGAYMACVLLYRGDIKVSDTNLAIQDIKKYKAINFVEWSPTDFKVGINNRPPTYVPGGDLAPLNKAVCMLSNNTTIREAWCRIIKKFNKMFQKRAFVHHFIGEGLEEDDLIEARDNICSLIDDYMLVEGHNNTTRSKEVQNQ